MDNIRNTLATWIAPQVPVKEEPKVVVPKEPTFEEKAEIVAGQVKKIATVVGGALIALVAIYSSLDKESKEKAGTLGSVLEAAANVSKFAMTKDVGAGSQGISSIIKLFTASKPTYTEIPQLFLTDDDLI